MCFRIEYITIQWFKIRKFGLLKMFDYLSTDQSTETTKIIFLITGSVFTVVIICLILGIWMCKFRVCHLLTWRILILNFARAILDRSYRKRKERKENVNILHNGILSYNNMAMRNRNGNVDINPTYDFNGRTLTTNDLPRISRDELKIHQWVFNYHF